MDLFDNTESYCMDTVVEDSKAFIRKKFPQQPQESREDYYDRLFYLVNDEIERRILISGKKRPDYSTQNITYKGSKKCI